MNPLILNRKNVFIIITLIAASGITFYLLDAAAVIQPKSASQALEQLFGDMGVIKVSHQTVPVEIRLKDVNGDQVSLSRFKGKIIFLNFWTTWCPTCRVEMPSMEKLHQAFKGKDFVMVTVNLQESAEQVRKFLKDFELTFRALLDSTGEVGMRFRINSIPTTLIIDKGGRLIGKVMGPREWDSKKSIALFAHLVDTYESPSVLKDEPKS